jgi:hypothetical protein
MIEVNFLAGAKVIFSLYHRVQISSGAHQPFYSVGTRDYFPRGKADGT